MTDALTDYPTSHESGKNWELYLGDSCERLGELADESVDLSIYSPPFSSLYTYSPSHRDIGNCRNIDEFTEHYRFVIDHMLRLTKPGRLSAVHVANTVTQKGRDGYIGLVDLRGAVIQAHIDAGWIYHGEVTVDKNPQALRHGSPVLTPKGWMPIESLAVGDQVIGPDGRPTSVEGVWPQGERPMFRVHTNDGASVDCDGSHLWTIRTARGTVATMTTEAICAAGARMPAGSHRFELPVVEPVQAPDAELPLDPYLVGVLLGDGCLSQPRSVDVLLDAEMRDSLPLPDRCTLRLHEGSEKGDIATYTIGHPDYHVNPVLSALRVLGLQGMRAWEKSVPESYMTGSVAQRLAVLQGLMDTDGTAKKNGQAAFSTVSAALAANVVELVESLGGLARTVTEWPTFRYGREIREGRQRFIVSVRLRDLCPFRLARKVSRWEQCHRQPHRWIEAVERLDESDQATCITVNHHSGLFVTNRYMITHNSQAVRTKSVSLLFATLDRDSAMNRPGLADYVCVFRKPGENEVPILPTQHGVTREDWITWASPCWYDIRESATLNAAAAREDADERHICPLQLPLIDRAVRLWSNPGELVCSPFAGIGSEGYQALLRGRRYVGCELKSSYFATACENLRRAEYEADLPTLFGTPEPDTADASR